MALWPLRIHIKGQLERPTLIQQAENFIKPMYHWLHRCMLIKELKILSMSNSSDAVWKMFSLGRISEAGSKPIHTNCTFLYTRLKYYTTRFCSPDRKDATGTTWSFENPEKRFGLLPAAGFPNRAPKAVVFFDTWTVALATWTMKLFKYKDRKYSMHMC